MNKKTETYQRAEKYVLAKAQGMSKEDAKRRAQYAPSTSSTAIERTEVYQEAEKSLKSAILGQITQDELAEYLVRNAKQEENINASNNAIKLAMDRVEPEQREDKGSEEVLVIMKK